MWRPDEGWEPLPGGRGPSTGGVWLDRSTSPVSVVKRLVAPAPGDAEELNEPGHGGWWRRPAAVAESGIVERSAGLRSAPLLDLTEDGDGITLRHAHVASERLPALFLARALGRFATTPVPRVGWLVHHQLAERLARVEWRGGWRTLERTPLADVAARLWQRRRTYLDRLATLPQVVQHGDAVPANFPARDAATAIGIDWGTLGTGPIGGDLGYLALSSPETLDVLLEAYLSGYADDHGSARWEADALMGARVTAVYTILNRAEWVLARVAGGEGALAGKFRHPSVAPTLRVLQRQYDHLEALL